MIKLVTNLRNLLLVAVLACTGAVSANAASLYLRTSSTADVAIDLGNIQQITFGEQNVSIALTDGSTVECALSDFTSLRTDNAGTPGSSSVGSVIATADSETWAVYDLKGNFLGTADKLAKANKTLQSSFTPGVYILKSQSQTLKLVVR